VFKIQPRFGMETKPGPGFGMKTGTRIFENRKVWNWD
jgi:hypothetical protein